MKSWCLSLAVLAAANLNAADVTVTIEPMFGVSGGAFTGLPEVRAAVLTQMPSASQVSHIVTGPLQPPPGGDGSGLIGGNYEGVNSATGEVLETGVIVFNVGTSTPTPGEVVSPIIGVIPRSGVWSGTVPQTTSLGGSSGVSSYAGTTLTFSLAASTVTGSATLDVWNENEFGLGAFTLSKGGTTYSFEEADFTRSGNVYSAVIVSSSATPSLNEVAYVMKITDNSDSDADGIPDLTDASSVWYGPFTTTTINGTTLVQSSWYGDFWILTEDSAGMWIYHRQWGYQYIKYSTGGWLLLFDLGVDRWGGSGTGWMALHRDLYPWLFAYYLSGGSYIYLEPQSGGHSGNWARPRWIWVRSGPLSSTGWFQVPVGN